MFKRLIFCAVLLYGAVPAFAQNAYDALRFSEQYTEGTARSVAMGNAFAALGGDMGGITINPASSAIYRYSEFQITPTVTGISSTTDYLGSNAFENNAKAGIASIGYVGSYSTGRQNAGLVSWSFGFMLTKQNSFNSSMTAGGNTDATSWIASLAANTNGIYAPDMDMNDNNNPFYNSNASWNSILGWNTSLLDTLPGTTDQYIAATENLNGYDISVGGDLRQIFYSKSKGNVTEAVINLGGNFANKLFLGVNIGIQSIMYSYEEMYAEEAVNPNFFQTGFEHFSTSYRYRATGSGINLKAGVIYLPVDWLRLGASISTPTWVFLNEEWENGMSAEFNDGYSQELMSPLGTYSYRLNTPFRWNIGAAFKFGTTGVLSIDYENTNYSKAKLLDTGYFGYADENKEIRNLLASQSIVRVGGELNATPAFAVRAGYQYYSTPYAGDSPDDAKHIGALGAGYSIPWGASNFFIDLAYQQLLNRTNEQFSLYSDTDIAAPTGTNRTGKWRVLLSLGFRF